MKLFKELMSHTLIGRLASAWTTVSAYVKDYNTVSDTLYSEGFSKVIQKYLKINLKKDWIGRLYGVINPHIDINGHMDLNNTIIEIDDDRTNDDEYVMHFIYKQMDLIGSLFKINKLYDYISCDVHPIDNYDNFLVVFDITSRKDAASAGKKLFWHLLLDAAIAIGLIFIL